MSQSLHREFSARSTELKLQYIACSIQPGLTKNLHFNGAQNLTEAETAKSRNGALTLQNKPRAEFFSRNCFHILLGFYSLAGLETSYNHPG